MRLVQGHRCVMIGFPFSHETMVIFQLHSGGEAVVFRRYGAQFGEDGARSLAISLE